MVNSSYMQETEMPGVVDVDVLIVGAGPSGASLACLLGSYGVNALMISDTTGPLKHPRANYFNIAGLECLREIGIEAKARAKAFPVSQYSTYTRFCKTLAGEEIYRSYVFGNDPHRHGAYADASPSETLCLCQTELEPLLIEHAADRGVSTKWQTRLVHFSQDANQDCVMSTVQDVTSGHQYVIRSKHMIAADGAKSQIVRKLEIPLVHGPGNGFVICAWIDADLSHLVEPTPGLLHYLALPDQPQPEFGVLGIAHFIKPWNNWVISLFPSPSYTKMRATEEQIMSRIRDLVGDDCVELKLKGISVWDFDEVYAKYYSVGNIHCVGNSVHQHPPFGGLGTSTCMEDAFNLAWKLAYVVQGKAGRSLLDTYSEERQPAGEYVVRRTNENGRLNFNFYNMLGYLDVGDPGRPKRIANLLAEDSDEGATMRDHFREAVNELGDERHCVGAIMNQWYKSSALYVNDESIEPSWPQTERERSLDLYTGTYPGWRVPHTWLGLYQPDRGPRLPLVSTRDVVGLGNFALLTGIGGKSIWSTAAQTVSASLGINIVVVSIGWAQDYEDTFFRWYEVRGVGEKGAVLVRPDRTVAWRAQRPPGDVNATRVKLTDVLTAILRIAPVIKRNDSGRTIGIELDGGATINEYVANRVDDPEVQKSAAIEEFKMAVELAS